MKKTLFTPALLFLFFFASLANAQDFKSAFSSSEIGNLVAGIKSENQGLKRCSIYLAAKYQVTETVPVLVEEFKKDLNPKNKVLIALAVYQIGDKSGIEAVYNASLNDENAKVRKTCFEVMSNFKNDESVVSNSK